MSTTSLDYAFGLLLERYAIPVATGVTLGDDPGKLAKVTEYYPDIEVIAMGQPGTWPETDDALISFRVQSVEEPTIRVGSRTQPNIVEAYYLVADYKNHLVVNPEYITPIHMDAEPIGWISYAMTRDPIGDPTERPEHRYIWVKDDNIWDVARRTGQDAKELLEHNDITNVDNIHPGLVLHLPRPRVQQSEPTITYEIHSPTKLMHITQAGGAHTWAFGNARKQDDIVKSGPTWAFNASVEVAATAHVPVGDETMDFYMTASSVGNYLETGRVSATTGFKDSHLAEGMPVDIPKPEPVPVVAPAVVIDDVKKEPFISKMDDPNFFKTTWESFGHPRKYIVQEGQYVVDYDSRAKTDSVRVGEPVMIAGTFLIGTTEYGRPAAKLEDGSWGIGPNDFWYGIRWKTLALEEDLQIAEIAKLTPAEKIALNRTGKKQPLSNPEKVWDVVSHTVGRGVRLTETVKKKLKGKV